MEIWVRTLMGAHVHAFLLSLYLDMNCWITGLVLVDRPVSQSGCTSLLPTSCVWELWSLPIFSKLGIVGFVISGEFVDRCHTELVVRISFLISELSMLGTCLDYLDNHLYKVPFHISCPFIYQVVLFFISICRYSRYRPFANCICWNYLFPLCGLLLNCLKVSFEEKKSLIVMWYNLSHLFLNLFFHGFYFLWPT